MDVEKQAEDDITICYTEVYVLEMEFIMKLTL